MLPMARNSLFCEVTMESDYPPKPSCIFLLPKFPYQKNVIKAVQHRGDYSLVGGVTSPFVLVSGKFGLKGIVVFMSSLWRNVGFLYKTKKLNQLVVFFNFLVKKCLIFASKCRISLQFLYKKSI